ncbi:MFS general substrate transporter [Pseudohyphozyma bogoriensis]|nr:MFS general substrate transporter [Pseudohyphozyma bogoriensis]
MWSPSERTAPFCFYAAFGLAGMMLGPPIGGFVGETLGYRWCDWISAIWGGLALLSCIIFLPETLAPILLKYKAQHLRRLTGDTRYRTSLETLRLSVPFKEHFKEALSRPFLMAVQEPIVILFSAYISVIYIVLLGNLSIYPVIFLQWGISDGILGLTFLPVMIGLLMAGALTPLVVKFHKMEVEKCRKEGKLTGPPPEERLRFAMVGTWCLPLSLFWLAWTCYPTKSIWISLASQLFFGIGTAACFISTYQYIIDAYLSTAASALSVLTLIRYFIAGAAVLFTIPMVNTLGVHWATTLLAFISLAFCPVPFIFYYYGATIRRWSKYTPRLPGDPVPDKSLA